jgi:hypothetical protein
MPGLVPGHPRLDVLLARKTWMARHRRAEATPSFGRLCPAMTEKWPLRQNRKLLNDLKLIWVVQSHLQKYTASRLPQITSISPAVSSHRGAARDRHGRGAGCGGRGGAIDEQRLGGRRSRVVLTPRRWCQVGGGNSADDGGKRARSPGRARSSR